MMIQDIPQLVLDADDEPAHPARKLVHAVLLVGLRDGATEIRFEPREDEYHLYLRIGETDYEMFPLPPFLVRRISQIFKVMADLDICNSRTFQFGRVHVATGSGAADLDITIRPTAHGESVLVAISNATVPSTEAERILHDWGMGERDEGCIEFDQE